jgi:nitroimidazol reductase NimA-like FMN-containing flavoprotein (pyridoxamine 5'-phosphate oxidase superfamily)
MAKRTFTHSLAEMEQLLRRETFGYLGLAMDGQPYVVPLNYAYAEGRILFHCALTGRKLDYLRANPRVCFTVGRQRGQVRQHDAQNPCDAGIDSDSVICYGTARLIEDLEERQAALNLFNRRFRADADDIPMERVERCGVVEIQVSEMTGRRELEQQRTYWRYTFER